MKYHSAFKKGVFVIGIASIALLFVTALGDAKATWRIYPPSGMALYPLAGEFSALPSLQDSHTEREISWKRAELIVSDPIFMIDSKDVKYNLWASLEKFEGNFRTDQVPHGPCGVQQNVEYIIKKYGKPDFVGLFQYRSGKQDPVYWYGPIFMMSSDKGLFEMGGWPSRIGQPISIPKLILPSFDYLILNGDNLVEIQNPNAFGATYGIRSKDPVGYSLGFDSYIKPNSSEKIHLQSGNYDLFLIYDENPKALFQGDSFNIKSTYSTETGTKATKLTVILQKVVGGNYPLRRVK